MPPILGVNHSIEMMCTANISLINDSTNSIFTLRYQQPSIVILVHFKGSLVLVEPDATLDNSIIISMGK